MYEEFKSEILHTTKFDENSDLGATYFSIDKSNKIKIKESVPIPEQGCTVGKLVNGFECQIHLDTGASKSFMSKTHYWRFKALQYGM